MIIYDGGSIDINKLQSSINRDYEYELLIKQRTIYHLSQMVADKELELDKVTDEYNQLVAMYNVLNSGLKSKEKINGNIFQTSVDAGVIRNQYESLKGTATHQEKELADCKERYRSLISESDATKQQLRSTKDKSHRLRNQNVSHRELSQLICQEKDYPVSLLESVTKEIAHLKQYQADEEIRLETKKKARIKQEVEKRLTELSTVSNPEQQKRIEQLEYELDLLNTGNAHLRTLLDNTIELKDMAIAAGQEATRHSTVAIKR